jgi:hypothetical protein
MIAKFIVKKTWKHKWVLDIRIKESETELQTELLSTERIPFIIWELQHSEK